jgi:hypothetical protein
MNPTKLHQLAMAYANSMVEYKEAQLECAKPGADRSWLAAERDSRDAMYEALAALEAEVERQAQALAVFHVGA